MDARTSKTNMLPPLCHPFMNIWKYLGFPSSNYLTVHTGTLWDWSCLLLVSRIVHIACRSCSF